MSAPLAQRMRPQTIDDIVGQRHLLGEGKPLRVQGCFISSEEIERVVNFVKENGERYAAIVSGGDVSEKLMF